MAMGAQIGYTTGDPMNLLDDLAVLRPHFFPTVPRVINRIYQSAMAAGTAPGIKGALFRRAVATKLHNLRATGAFHHTFYDRIVFRKVSAQATLYLPIMLTRYLLLQLAAVLGGRMRLFSSGSAPISANVMDFMKIGILSEVIEGAHRSLMPCLILCIDGLRYRVKPNHECKDLTEIKTLLLHSRYGMTENCASFVRTWTYDPKSSGTVGAPLPNCELKLIDVPSMGYSAEDKPYPRGEICMRGEQRFTCYFKGEVCQYRHKLELC